MKEVEFTETDFIVGRSDTLKASVPSCSTLSRKHLKIELINGDLWFTDLNSSNGTFVAGEKITPNKPMQYSGGIIRIGSSNEYVELTLKLNEDGSSLMDNSSSSENTNSAFLKYNSQNPQHNYVPPTPHSNPIPAPQPASVYSSPLFVTQSKEEIQKKNLELEKIQNEIAASQANLKQTENKILEHMDREAALRRSLVQLEMQLKKNEESIMMSDLDLSNILQKKEGMLADLQETNQKLMALSDLASQKEQEYQKNMLQLMNEFEITEREVEYKKKKSEMELESIESELKMCQTRLEYDKEDGQKKKQIVEKKIEELNEKLSKMNEQYQEISLEKKKLDIEFKANEKKIADFDRNILELQRNQEFLNAEAKMIQDRIKKCDEDVKNRVRDCDVKVKEKLDDANKIARSMVEKAEIQAEKFKNEADSFVAQKEQRMLADINLIKQAADQYKTDAEEEILEKENKSQTEVHVIRQAADQYKADIETEMQGKERLLQAELDRIRSEADHEMVLKMEKCSEEVKVIQQRALKEYELEKRSWNDEVKSIKEKDLQELRLFKAAEEKRVKDLLLQAKQSIARSVAMNALAYFQGQFSKSTSPDSQVIPYPKLMTSLEKELANALDGQISTMQNLNPNLSKSKKVFWYKSAAGVAASFALILSLIYLPSIARLKIASMKDENKIAEDKMLQEIRVQRQKMLALHLEIKSEFQDTYVDNILYNPGYLSMKQDQGVQKEWTLGLTKVFLNELMYDERKVVDYIPLESSLISLTAEIYHILNNQNYTQNLVEMRKIEEKKMQDILKLVGGKENWLKLRKYESEFYYEHVTANPTMSGTTLGSEERTPAKASAESELKASDAPQAIDEDSSNK